MIELAAKLAGQNRILRAQRDLVLPKLVSGEIEIDAASRPFRRRRNELDYCAGEIRAGSANKSVADPRTEISHHGWLSLAS